MPLIEKKKKKEISQRRKHTRFAPDPGTFAQIDTDPKSPAFRPDHFGLVIEESYTGCGVVIVDLPALKEGARLKIQVGSLHPLKGEVVWRKNLDAQVARLGIRYDNESGKK